MDYQLINRIIDLILENKGVQNLDSIKNQRNNFDIEGTEDLDNSKYVSLKVKENIAHVDTSSFGVISVMFWELTQNIPIDCILHFKNGYINGLEIYSCDGRNFEDIDINNIDIKDRSPVESL